MLVRELCAGDDLAIVASDGLWDVIGPGEACAIAAGAGDAARAARALSEAALRKGSGDNVSVVVVDLRCRRAEQLQLRRNCGERTAARLRRAHGRAAAARASARAGGRPRMRP